MENEISILEENSIRSKIHVVRGQQVMLDRDLAELYGVETKVLNQAVKRNIERFPENFMFQLEEEEYINWRSQFVTSNSDKMGLRRPPLLDFIEKHQIDSDVHQKETDKKVDKLFSLMDKYNVKETQGIFFQGQIFDAYAKFESFCPQQRKKSFYALYLTAGLSDMIDGPVARKTGSASDFGSACLHSSNNCRNPGRTFYPNEKSKI